MNFKSVAIKPSELKFSSGLEILREHNEDWEDDISDDEVESMSDKEIEVKNELEILCATLIHDPKLEYRNFLRVTVKIREHQSTPFTLLYMNLLPITKGWIPCYRDKSLKLDAKCSFINSFDELAHRFMKESLFQTPDDKANVFIQIPRLAKVIELEWRNAVERIRQSWDFQLTESWKLMIGAKDFVKSESDIELAKDFAQILNVVDYPKAPFKAKTPHFQESDYHAQVLRVVDKDGREYAWKLTYRPSYEEVQKLVLFQGDHGIVPCLGKTLKETGILFPVLPELEFDHFHHEDSYLDYIKDTKHLYQMINIAIFLDKLGYCCRNFKPANCMRNDDGDLILIDAEHLATNNNVIYNSDYELYNYMVKDSTYSQRMVYSICLCFNIMSHYKLGMNLNDLKSCFEPFDSKRVTFYMPTEENLRAYCEKGTRTTAREKKRIKMKKVEKPRIMRKRRSQRIINKSLECALSKRTLRKRKN